jgi:hypothetical protein
MENAERVSWHQAATQMQQEILELSVELRYQDQTAARESTKPLHIAGGVVCEVWVDRWAEGWV